MLGRANPSTTKRIYTPYMPRSCKPLCSCARSSAMLMRPVKAPPAWDGHLEDGNHAARLDVVVSDAATGRWGMRGVTSPLPLA